MRARIDVSEIEAQTKIRAKYLRALENEEWDLLPGPTFVRSFLRTYAQALGLDDKALVDEYRRQYEQPSELEHQPVMSSARGPRPRPIRDRRAPPGAGGGFSRSYAVALGVLGVVILLLIVGLIAGKKGGSPPTQASSTSGRHTHTPRHRTHGSSRSGASTRSATSARVALSLKPTAAIYVCLIDAAGAKRIPGLTLEPGSYTSRTYHSTRFELLLGNNAVTLYVDGRALSVPASSKPIAYSITGAGRHTLSASQQPKCE